MAGIAMAQSPGMVVKQAGTGRPVLDPNLDGYTSATAAGFTSNDRTESEVTFVPMVFPAIEPLGDLSNGASGSAYDFVDLSGTVAPVYVYLSPDSNLAFRFRMASISPTSKGYSVLIDTDKKFGNTGPAADPNYTAANPGFEAEILLATNTGILLYNIDGLSTPGAPLVTLAYADYAQKSMALTTAGSSPDYFVDFFIPLSTVKLYLPALNTTKPVRMAMNTVLTAQSALQGTVADVAGVDGSTFSGNAASMWTYLIGGQDPTALKNGLPVTRSHAPVVANLANANGTSVSGTSEEANGATITVYVNGVSAGTTTVTGYAWTKTGISPALVAGQTVTATALATGKTVSDLSSAVTVSPVPVGCTATPVITGLTTNARGITGTAPAGATIRVYSNSTLQTNSSGANFVTANGSGVWTFAWCTAGSNCGPCGSLTATATGTGNCTSALSAPYCYNSGLSCALVGVTATPSITTNPITPTTATVTGFADLGSVVTLYINGYSQATQTLGALATAYSFSGIQYQVGNVVEVRARSGANCNSAPASRTVTETSVTPIILTPIVIAASIIGGYSSEPPGSIIKVYNNGTLIGTTTVNAIGLWTVSGIAPGTLIGLSSITATATGPGRLESAPTNPIVILSLLTFTTPAPVITGSYTEGATSVSGTAAGLASVKVYQDGVQIGTTTAAAGGGWTLSGLSVYDLHPGSVLTAKATSGGQNESPASTGVTVQCATQSNKSVTPTSQSICQNAQASIQVLSSSATSLYVLRNAANTADAGKPVLGNGGTITLGSYTISGTGSNTYHINAVRSEAPQCPALVLTTAPSITANSLPTTSLAVTPVQAVVCNGSAGAISVANSQSGFQYQLRDSATSANIGTAITGTGGAITLPAGTITSTKKYKVQATDATLPTSCQAPLSQIAKIRQNCPGSFVKRPELSVNQYHTGDTLAWATDPDGIASASFLSGTLPPGTSLSPQGMIWVSNAAALWPGTYNLNVSATDGDGMATPFGLSFTFGVAPLPVTLQYFRGQAISGSVYLRWGTSREKNSARFDVERSAEGKSFWKIGSVQAKGNSATLQEYGFVDTAPPTGGAAYYRLRQVDLAGEESLSPVITVWLAANGKLEAGLALYPNPASDLLMVTGLAAHSITYELCDLTGRSVKRSSGAVPAAGGEILLSVKGLPAGSYMLRIKDGNSRSAVRFQVR